MTKHLVIVATHPIQYHIPLYQHIEKLSQSISAPNEPIKVSVLYLFTPDQHQQGVGFNKSFQWNMDLFDGYESQVVNASHITINQDNPWGFFGLRLKNVRQLIKSLNANVMLITGWQSFGLMQLSLAAKSLKIPLMIRGESNGFEPKPWLSQFLMSKYVSLFDHFFCIGTANKKYYLDRKVNPKKLISAPYFVDNSFFSSQNNHELELKKDIKKTTFTLCFCGKLEPKKNIFHVLKAIQKLNHPNIKLIVIGSGDQMTDAQEFVKTHQLNVDFKGFLNQLDIRAAYQQCDCIVLPSNYKETWGLVLNEAMLHEMPAIVSNQVGSHPDLIINDKTGWVYPFADIEKLAVTIEHAADLFFNDLNKYNSIRIDAKKHVIENFTVDNTASAMIKAVQSL